MGRPAIAVAIFLLSLPCMARQQDQSAPPPQQNPPAAAKKSESQSSQPKKKPSTSDQNPFPEAQSEAAAREASRQDNNASPDGSAPNAPAARSSAPSAKPSTADRNPFPEAQSEKAARQDQSHQDQSNPQPPEGTDPGAAGNDSSSSQSGLKGLNLPGTDPSSADSADGIALDPKLALQDTQVGLFYLRTGDFKGAYGRFAEATRVDPGNAEAVFGLAEAARHLNDRRTAISNYQLYLAAVPRGPHAKDARKALKDLGATPGS